MHPPSLFCPIRKIWVKSLPEERVRQALIQEMIRRLGFPASSMTIEKQLSKLPHLQHKTKIPNRRADLIVFAQGLHVDHPFYPLLLAECKAVPLTPAVLRQIVGYNQFVAAKFIVAANETSIYLGYYHKESNNFIFKQGLLPYDTLLYLASK